MGMMPATDSSAAGEDRATKLPTEWLPQVGKCESTMIGHLIRHHELLFYVTISGPYVNLVRPPGGRLKNLKPYERTLLQEIDVFKLCEAVSIASTIHLVATKAWKDFKPLQLEEPV